MRRGFWFHASIALLAIVLGCHAHDHDHADHDHEHPHQSAQAHDQDHGHGHEDSDHEHLADGSHPPGRASDDHGHDHPHDEHGGHGDDSGHGHGHEAAAESFTSWGTEVQLYVEHPSLVVGEEVTAAVHLTKLVDHLPLDHGRVTLFLSGGSVPLEEFKLDGPARPGVFPVVVNPARAGLRHLSITWRGKTGQAAFEVGELRVYSSAEQVKAAHHDQEADISFSLEQQWRIPFRLGQVHQAELRPNLAAFARLTAPSDAETMLHAPRAGRLIAGAGTFPVVGQTIAKGEPLFALDTVPGEGGDPASLDLAVEQAQIQVKAARRALERLEPLVAQRVVAQRRLDEVRAEWESARAALQGAERRRESVLRQGRAGQGTTIPLPSPLRGTLAELFVAPGEWVLAGQPVGRVVDRQKLWLDVQVPESYIHQMTDIAGVWCRFGSEGPILDLDRADLVSIATEVEPSSRTLVVRFAVDNRDGRLFAGMTTRASLLIEPPRRVTVVPLEAIIDDAGLDVVYVQTGGERFERRLIRTGIRDGEWIEIIEGVDPGEWLVTRGAYAVRLAATNTDTLGHGHAH